MKGYTKTLELSDYSYLRDEIQTLEVTTSLLTRRKIPVVVQHRHRMWEYGMAIAVMRSIWQGKMDGKKILDIGAGCGLLGPALSYGHKAQVTEIDSSPVASEYRHPLNSYFAMIDAPLVQTVHESIRGMVTPDDPDLRWDVVFCISTLEHLLPAEESIAWEKFDGCLKPGGILFVTMDCMEEDKPLGSYSNDNCRGTRFTPDAMRLRVGRMVAKGYEAIGETDYQYHGNQVADYTFASIGLRKQDGMVSDIELGM